MASGDEGLFQKPNRFLGHLQTCMTPNDGNRLAKAFEDAISTSWEVFGQFYLNLSLGDVENIREERGRVAQVSFPGACFVLLIIYMSKMYYCIFV